MKYLRYYEIWAPLFRATAISNYKDRVSLNADHKYQYYIYKRDMLKNKNLMVGQVDGCWEPQYEMRRISR